jgi:hypothetical protein
MRPTSKIFITNGGLTTDTLTVDTLGYTYLTIIGTTAGTAGAIATTSKVQESDDNSTYADVTGSAASATTTSAATVAKVAWNIDLRGRKRYIKAAVVQTGSTNNLVTIVGLAQNASKDQPVTATGAAVTNLLNI